MAVNGLNYTSGNELKFTTNSIERGVVTSGGTWGFGTLSPNSIVHISGATDPLTITGLQSGSDANILTIDGSGVVGTRGDVVVAGSITNNVITLTDSDASTTNLTVAAITGVSYSSAWDVAFDGSGSLATSPVALPFITGGTVNTGAGSITLEINDGLESDIVISGLDLTDTFVYGGAYDSATGVLTLDRNDNQTITISGDSWSYFESAAIANNTISLTDNAGVDTDLNVEAFTGVSIASNVITLAGSHLSDDSVTVDAVTGASFSLATGDITWGGSGSYDASLSLGTDFVTGVTEANNVISVVKNGGAASNLTIDAVTGLTIVSNVISYEGSGSFGSDITVDALTSASYSDWGINASGTGTVSGNFELPFITGGSYNAGSDELTLVINGGVESNIVISGFEGSDTFVYGGDYDSATGTLTLDRNDNQTITISGDSWSYFESAAIANNTISLTDNADADTDLNVEAFTGVSIASNVITLAGSHLSDDSVTVDAVTGGTFDPATGIITVAGSNSISNIDLGTDFVTGVTEVNNVITVGVAGSGTSDLTIDAVTAITYNNDWDIAYEGSNIGSTNVELPFITGGSYNSGTDELTLVINGGAESNIVISGFEGSDTFLTGVTVGAGTGSVDFELNDVAEDFTASGFNFVTSGDSGTSTINLQGSLEIVGLDGITTSDNGSGQISIDLDDTAVSTGEYGSASETVTFTVDQQGRLTAASEQSIEITASQVSDFAVSAETAIFQDGNFVDGTGIDFTVTEGASVSASLTDTGVSAGNYGSSSQVAQFDVDAQGRITAVSGVTIDGSAIDNNTLTFEGTDSSTASQSLNGTITFTSLDNSVAISGNGSTIDVQVSDTAITNIYTADGTLGGARTVSQAGNSLTFAGGDFKVSGNTFNVDASQESVGVGVETPDASAVLEVASTSKGFLFPRMTETERGNISSAATGLMVYQTDGDEGIYIKKSFGWVQVI